MDLLLPLSSFAIAAVLGFKWLHAMFVEDNPDSLGKVFAPIRPVRPENFYALSCPSGAVTFAGWGVILLIQAITGEQPDELLERIPLQVSSAIMGALTLCTVIFLAGFLWPFRLPAAINPATRARARARRASGTAAPLAPISSHPDLPSPFPAFIGWLAIAIVLYFSRHLHAQGPGASDTPAKAHLIVLALVTVLFIVKASRRSSSIPPASEMVEPRNQEAYARLDDKIRGRKAAFSLVIKLYSFGLLFLVISPLVGYEVVEALIGLLT